MKCIRGRHTFAAGALALLALGACGEEQPAADLELATAPLAVIPDHAVYVVNGLDPLVSAPNMAHAPSGKCLDVTDFKTGNGSGVQLYTCLSGVNQRWTYDETTKMLRGLNSGRCLDVPVNNPNATYVQIWDCNKEAAQQRWAFTNQGQLKSLGTGKCLDIAGYGSGDGAALQLWTCHTDGNQKWTRGVNVLRARYSSSSSDKCVSVQQGQWGVGGPVSNQTCNPTPAGFTQEWRQTFNGSLMLTATALPAPACLSGVKATDSTGTVSTGICNGDSYWHWRPAGDVVHVSSDLCLDVSGGSVHLATCTAGGDKPDAGVPDGGGTVSPDQFWASH